MRLDSCFHTLHLKIGHRKATFPSNMLAIAQCPTAGYAKFNLPLNYVDKLFAFPPFLQRIFHKCNKSIVQVYSFPSHKLQ